MNNKSEFNYDVYKKNIDALQIKYKHIALRVSKNISPPPSLLETDNSFLQNTSPNRKSFLQRLLPSNPFSNPYRNIIFINIFCFIKARRQVDSAKKDAFKIIIYEPNIDVFQKALHIYDISKYLQEEHILFIVGSNNYFPALKRLDPVRVHERDLMYTAYHHCKSFFNYEWPLIIITENSTKNIFSFIPFLFQRADTPGFSKVYKKSGRVDKKDYERVSISLFLNLFSQLKFAHNFIEQSKHHEKQDERKSTAILVFKSMRLWNWVELFKRGLEENGFNVEFVEIDREGKYVPKILGLITAHYPCILVTINRYAFDNYYCSIALEDILREKGIPYMSFVLDHLDYFYWEAEPRYLDNCQKYKLITYDRFFHENYLFGCKPFELNPFFSFYINKKAQKDYQYDICISNRPREKYMRIFPEQEVIYRKILEIQTEPNIPVSSRLYIILWKLVNKIDDMHRPNINRHIVLNAVRCFKMGFDSFFRRDIAQFLCCNYENVAVFGKDEWKNYIPMKNYKGMVTYKEMLEIYSKSRIIVDSFMSWSDTTVHDYVSLSQGGFTLFHKPAICYNNIATRRFEYFSTWEELNKKISLYLSNENLRLQKLEEMQADIDNFFSFNDYFKRASALCNELMHCPVSPLSKNYKYDDREFGTFVNKCNLSIFESNKEQFVINFMAAIVYFYAGYIGISAECLNAAKRIQSLTDKELDIFEEKIKAYYSHQV